MLRTETYTDKNDVERKKDYFGYIDENGNEVITSTWDRPSVEPEPVEPEPTPDSVMEKLNRMEATLNALTADSVTVANVETAILEGVNEV